MATINDKLEQQNAQTRELTDEELDQAAGGDVGHPLEVVIDLGPSIPQPETAHVVSGFLQESSKNTSQELPTISRSQSKFRYLN